MGDPNSAASAMSAVIVGVESLDPTLAFFRDVVGLVAGPVTEWRGPAFETFWQLPEGASARTVMLSRDGDDVGRVLLAEFEGGDRKPVRAEPFKPAIGYFNLNLYPFDMAAAMRDMERAGLRPWTEPMTLNLGEAAGSAEVVTLEGPDTTTMSLIHLLGDESTAIGRMRAYASEHGRTRTGYSCIVTASQWVNDLDAATEFFSGVLGFTTEIDATNEYAASAKLLRVPADSTRAIRVFKGRHMFGKVEILKLIGHELPSLERTAKPPNYGTIAQCFDVEDGQRAEDRCREIGATVLSPLQTIDLPGIGSRRAFLVRSPGSGALAVLYERPA